MGWFHEAYHTNKKIAKKREIKYKSKFMKAERVQPSTDEINMISISCREPCLRLSHEKTVSGTRKAFKSNAKNDTIVSR
jgi:hypothetical protein